MLGLDDVKSLAAARISPAVSIFLPTHPTSREVRQDPARLKNLATEAERRLIERGLRSVAAHEIVQPALSLAGDAEFWRQGGEGVALFLGPHYDRHYRVPAALQEEVAVAERFSVKPLLPLVAENEMFSILAISAAHARVFEARRFHVSEVQGLKMPQGVGTVEGETEYQDTVSRLPGWRARHGMGKVSNAGEAPEELRRTELMEYLTRVGSVLNDYFSGKRAPVVLAALPDLQGNLRQILQIEGLLESGLEINPEAYAPEELRDRAYELVRPGFAAAQAQALDRFNMLYGEGSPKVSTAPAEIVEGSLYSRIDTLLLANGAQLWGQVDENAGRIDIHENRAPEDEDLSDRAAIETLLHGGRVVVLPKGQVPAQGPMAAIFRY